MDPCLLFLDEPSAGLDPITSAGLDALIRELARGLGITFIMVTHELASIYSVADRVVVLDPKTRGIAAEGPPSWLRENANQPWVRQFLRRDAAVASRPLILELGFLCWREPCCLLARSLRWARRLILASTTYLKPVSRAVSK